MLGDDGFKAFSQYERSYGYQAAYLPSIQSDLAGANLPPLTADQAQTLALIISANNHPYKANPSDLSGTSKIDWNGVVAQSGGLLSPDQLTAL